MVLALYTYPSVWIYYFILRLQFRGEKVSVLCFVHATCLQLANWSVSLQYGGAI
jgi:hypothetical protein